MVYVNKFEDVIIEVLIYSAYFCKDLGEIRIFKLAKGLNYVNEYRNRS